MRSVTYVGPRQRVEIEVAPRRWRTVAHGETTEVSDQLAESLLEQSIWVEPGTTTRSAEVPDGSIREVVAWVDGDPERARQAIAAELEVKARKGLLAQLQQIAGTDADDTDTTGADSTEEG